MNPCGGHFATKRTTFKILTTGYCWPTPHKDEVNYTRKCDKCQTIGQPARTDEMPLNHLDGISIIRQMGNGFYWTN